MSNEKQTNIVNMFDKIASTYDITNRVLSFGIDKRWRRKGCDKAYELLEKKELNQITDVATGTGDLLLYWKERALKHNVEVKKFLGIDPSVGMLEIAKKKKELDFATFIEAKAQKLPIEDSSTDIISISYGIRNVVDRKEALEEFFRALTPNGLVVILEFTKQEKKGFIPYTVSFYMNRVLPTLGGLVSRNYKAYKYLPDSIEGFLTTEMLKKELEEVGFTISYEKSFSFGISTLLIAKKVV